MTNIVNITETEDYDVYIGRGSSGYTHINNTDPGDPGWLGNPYRVGKDGTREEVVQQFEDDFMDKIRNDDEFRDAVHNLKGKTLGCFCKPKLCHGDVIANYLTRQELGEEQ